MGALFCFSRLRLPQTPPYPPADKQLMSNHLTKSTDMLPLVNLNRHDSFVPAYNARPPGGSPNSRRIRTS
jgi:hypothetical protein